MRENLGAGVCDTMDADTSARVAKAKCVVRGAICGDIIGSPYERHQTKDYGFALHTPKSQFTDDTVCTIAVADALTGGGALGETLQRWCLRYPRAGYGGCFRHWITSSNPLPYGSFGNGSAMRVSSVGALATSVEECLQLAEWPAAVTHNHTEGIKGAQAVALAIFLALEGHGKERIKAELERRFGYDLSRAYAEIQRGYRFESSCQKSVPEAIIAFLVSEDYESAVRRAVALGGDADTQATIAGSIAAAYYGEIPDDIIAGCVATLPAEMMCVIYNVDDAIDEKHGR